MPLNKWFDKRQAWSRASSGHVLEMQIMGSTSHLLNWNPCRGDQSTWIFSSSPGYLIHTQVWEPLWALAGIMSSLLHRAAFLLLDNCNYEIVSLCSVKCTPWLSLQMPKIRSPPWECPLSGTRFILFSVPAESSCPVRNVVSVTQELYF